jgi:hypothetical protein
MLSLILFNRVEGLHAHLKSSGSDNAVLYTVLRYLLHWHAETIFSSGIYKRREREKDGKGDERKG